VPTAAEQQEWAALYGWSTAVLNSNPELAKLFRNAIAGKWNQSRFVAALRGTNWYKQHSESVRQAQILAKADPTEYKARVAQTAATISDLYHQMTGRRMGGPTASHLAVQAFQLGMNDAQVQDLVRKTVSSATLLRTGSVGGTLGDAEKQIRQAASDLGIAVSETYVMNAMNNIAWQNTDTTAEIAKLRKMSASRYPQYAEVINGGGSIKDVAEEYKQLMAKTLEIPDDSIAITDRHIQAALTFRPASPAAGANNSGKPPTAPTGMPLWQFEQQLKNDPRWLKTKGAQDGTMAAARQVLTDLGFQGVGGQ
jgi:hypothetical protein